MQTVVEEYLNSGHRYRMRRGEYLAARQAPKAVGKRLQRLRSAKNLSQDEIAASIDMATGSALWTRYESGKYLIPVINANKLCDVYGITLDWLYRGVEHAGMPYDLARDLRALEMQEERAKKPGQ